MELPISWFKKVILMTMKSYKIDNLFQLANVLACDVPMVGAAVTELQRDLYVTANYRVADCVIQAKVQSKRYAMQHKTTQSYEVKVVNHQADPASKQCSICDNSNPKYDLGFDVF